MRKIAFCGGTLCALLLTGCNGIGDKAASLTAVYCAAALLSGLLLVGCCFVVGKKNPWFLLLFSSVLVVNIGYYALSTSQSLESALFANRIAYLGSVFLPLAMWMIILKVTGISLCRWVPYLLFALGAMVFFVAASPGYSDIYYKEVFFEKIDGVSVLKKVYGPLHVSYLIYLLGYFFTMVITITYAARKKIIQSTAYAVILAIAVFVNIGVWLIEQLVKIDFEILSVSYIISELFLLGLYLLMAETEKQKTMLVQQTLESAAKTLQPQPEQQPETVQLSLAERELFQEGLKRLTPKEQELLGCYVSGMAAPEAMKQLQITQNTLKYHNRNLYSKLGVNSRAQLVSVYRMIADTQPGLPEQNSDH